MKHRYSTILTIVLMNFAQKATGANNSYEISTEFSGQSSSTALQDQLSTPGQRVWSLGINRSFHKVAPY
ncbi:MAG: hypothetical protein HRU09_21235 [Oligoflexales bacterium]|nr:hypothetical protein [Oligoflexales bacterium]